MLNQVRYQYMTGKKNQQIGADDMLHIWNPSLRTFIHNFNIQYFKFTEHNLQTDVSIYKLEYYNLIYQNTLAQFDLNNHMWMHTRA